MGSPLDRPVTGAPAEKDAWRSSVRAARRRLRPTELHENAIALRDVLLGVPEVGRSAVVAAYVSVGNEPGTGPLLEALLARDVRVLLPVVTPDLDLDWAVYDDPDGLVSARMGLLQPAGPRLGVDAIGGADAALVPGLAVDRLGVRLGQGGGCYDRALPRMAPDAFSCVILHDGELADAPMPRDPHDQLVQAAATPSGLFRFR